MYSISEDDYINLGFCFDCPDCRDDCGDFCALYQYLMDESENRSIDDFCENCDYCDCDHTSEGCQLIRQNSYKLFHARDIILDRRWQKNLSLKRNGVKEIQL